MSKTKYMIILHYREKEYLIKYCSTKKKGKNYIKTRATPENYTIEQNKPSKTIITWN